ncbi:uncharacterized protein LOC133337516 [Musca vetustissima]|uniref:uncharacterized protein LOC133337516 n=1 Tax=Musca vetustissima TaxID=27455 RepID=UPI002AB7EF86|nr:uncharacterized protein LOC133337516 [Musca vetustissima]
MPNFSFLNRFQPAPLYIVLFLSICYFSVQLILSHLTHALTLLMASYHMLCNILALAGSIVTIKHNELHNSDEEKRYSETNLNKNDSTSEKMTAVDGIVSVAVAATNETEIQLRERKRREQKTRNTFGWARIEILTMLIICITLASLSFSLLVEALQTLVHIDHQDSMHLPVHVMILGVVGLLLNGFTYILIGGYTLHQGNFLHINPMGNVVVEASNITVETNGLTKGNAGDHQLKEDLKAELGKVHYRTRREGPAELLRDLSSTIFVIVCAVIVHFAKDKEHTAKFIDPVLSIFSCVLVVALSYPYMKEACMILLQTVPGTIDMENFERNLVTKFPQIVSYHDLHIWQLSSHSYIATIHIIFKTPKLYEKTIEDVKSHFQEHRIAHVTIQPEFQAEGAAMPAIEGAAKNSMECLMQCQNPDCADKLCCKDSQADLREVSVCDGHGHGKKSKKHHNHHHGHDHHGHGHSHAHGHSHNKKKAATSHKHGKSCSKSVTKNDSSSAMEMGKQEEISVDSAQQVPMKEEDNLEETPTQTAPSSTATAKTELASVGCDDKTTEASNDQNQTTCSDLSDTTKC